jgi:hypothetical protein
MPWVLRIERYPVTGKSSLPRLPIMTFPGHLPSEASYGLGELRAKESIMEPVTMVAIGTALISAVGTIAGAWVGGRAQRQPRGEQSQIGQAGDLPASSRIDQGTRVQAIEAGAATGREFLPDDHR